MCENHSEMQAIANCEICGKPVCGDCAVSKDGKTYCDESAHAALYEEFDKLFTTMSVFEMELVAKNLEANGIPVVWFNPKKFGVDEQPSAIGGFVRKEQTGRAVDILKELDILDFTSLHTHDK